MTYEQAQTYIKLFILQHYDEIIVDLLPDVKCKRTVGKIIPDGRSYWWVRGYGYVFWVREIDKKEQDFAIQCFDGKDIDILKLINLEDET